MFNGLFTRYPQAIHNQIAELKRDLASAFDRIDELTSEHRKLRGRFYAARGEITQPAAPQAPNNVSSLPESREARKMAALQAAGFVPGRADHLKGKP